VLYVDTLHSVASPGFVARRGKTGDYVMVTHGGLHARVQQTDRATDSFVTAILIERAVSC